MHTSSHNLTDIKFSNPLVALAIKIMGSNRDKPNSAPLRVFFTKCFPINF